MTTLFGRILAILGAMTLIGFAGSAAAQVSTTTALDNATTQTNRVMRLGSPSTCSAAQAVPSLYLFAVDLAYDSYTLTNTSGSTQCYDIFLTQTASDLFVVAYSGSFSPADPSLNYLGDAGSSTQDSSFSVNVPNGQTLVVVVHEVGRGTGVGQTYTVTASAHVAPPAPVPTMSEWAMILLATILAGGTALYLQRRRLTA